MERMRLWYAVNRDGNGHVFAEEPARDDGWGIWVGRQVTSVREMVSLFVSEGFTLPILTWADNPVMLTLTLDFG